MSVQHGRFIQASTSPWRSQKVWSVLPSTPSMVSRVVRRRSWPRAPAHTRLVRRRVDAVDRPHVDTRRVLGADAWLVESVRQFGRSVLPDYTPRLWKLSRPGCGTCYFTQ